MVLALTQVLVLTLALAPSGMISKKGVPDFCPSTVVAVVVAVVIYVIVLVTLVVVVVVVYSSSSSSHRGLRLQGTPGASRKVLYYY